MGCFSFKCKECGKPINSDSFRGEGVKLFLLQDSSLLEEKEGDYDSYGGVFTESKWKNDWNEIVNLIFNNRSSDGIAAIHTDCWYSNNNPKTPTEISEDDENQGWGKIMKKSAPEVKSIFYDRISPSPISTWHTQKNDIEILEKISEFSNKLEDLIKELKNEKA